MPRLELWDPVRMAYRCDTLSMDRLGDWLGEWLPRLFENWPDEPGYEPMVTVHPLFHEDGKTPDWPADTRFIGEPFKIPRDPHKAMAALRAKHRELIKLIEEEARR